MIQDSIEDGAVPHLAATITANGTGQLEKKKRETKFLRQGERIGTTPLRKGAERKKKSSKLSGAKPQKDHKTSIAEENPHEKRLVSTLKRPKKEKRTSVFVGDLESTQEEEKS